MAITQEQADTLASQYGAQTLTQADINAAGLTQADIERFFPGFDIASSGFTVAQPVGALQAAAIAPDVAKDLMWRSMTTGVPTSEFDKYGGYEAVQKAYTASGGQYDRSTIPASNLRQYAQTVADTGSGNLEVLRDTGTKLSQGAIAAMTAAGVENPEVYATQYGVETPLDTWTAPDVDSQIRMTGRGRYENVNTGEVYYGAAGLADAKQDVINNSKKDILANAYAAGDFAGVKNFLERTGTTGYDLTTMFGLTPEQRAKIATDTGFNMQSKTITDYQGTQYDTQTLLNLANQLAAVTDVKNLSGGAFAENRGNIGFDYYEAARAVGHDINSAEQVLLDAARGLIKQGVTDLSQLKQGDIKSTVSVNQAYDPDTGQPTGSYVASWGDPESGTYGSRALTPEEAARITRTAVDTGEGGTYDKLTLNDMVTGQGLMYGDKTLSADPGFLSAGQTYTGEGYTSYGIRYDAQGKPHFYTQGGSSSDLGDISMMLSIASFVPGVAPFAMAANAAIQASQGNTLGALASLAGAGGYTNVATAFNAANAIENGNVSALVGTLLANPSLNAAAQGTMLTDTISLADVGHGANTVVNIQNGNYGGALSSAGALTGSSDLKVAGAATTIVNELGKDTPNLSVVINAGKTIDSAINSASTKIDSNVVTGLADKVTSTLTDATGAKDVGSAAYIAAKNAGATDDEAAAAANAVTGKTATADLTQTAEEPAGLTQDEVIAERTRLGEAYAKSLGKDIESLTDAEIDRFVDNVDAYIAKDPNALKNASLQDIFGSGDRAWVDDKGVYHVEITGTGDKPVTLADNLEAAGNDLVEWANTLEGTSGDTMRQTLSTLIGAGGEQVADLGTALSNMGVADRYNLLVQLGQSLERTGQNLEIPGVTQATQNFWNDIQGADTYSGKVAAAVKSVVNNPLVLTQVAKEGFQEVLPIVAGGAVFKLAGTAAAIGTDMLLNAAESMGSTSRSTYNEEIAKGATPEEAQALANSNGWKAFAITAGTAGLADASLVKSYEKAMEKVAGRVVSSTGKEYAEEGLEELAIAVATGDDLATALSKSVVGSMIGAKTSGSIQASTDAKSSIQEAFESEGLTSTDGTFRPSTIVKAGDANTTAAVHDTAGVITDTVAANGDVPAAINTAVVNGVQSGANAKAVVDTAVSTGLTNGVDASVAVGNVVSSAIDVGVKPGTAISSAVDTAVNSGANTTVAVATAVNSAVNTGVSTNTATDAVASTGVNVTTDVDSNTTTATDTNTGETATVTTDTNTDTTVTTEVNADTGEITVTHSDGTAVDGITGEVLTPEEVEKRKSKSKSASAARGKSALTGATVGTQNYPYKPTDIEETWLGGRFRNTGTDLAALAALFGNTPMQQESEALSALRRASGLTDKREVPDTDYFSYGREVSPAETLGAYRNGGTVQNLATGGKIMASPLMAATGGDVPHKGSHYVQGAGGGQDDLIPAKLADGEYVFDAEIVAALGDGSNKEGAKKLDAMREAIRRHKRSGSTKTIPPKAKSPLAYLKESMK